MTSGMKRNGGGAIWAQSSCKSERNGLTGSAQRPRRSHRENRSWDCRTASPGWRPLEIQVGVVGGWRGAGDAVSQDPAETGTGLHSGVPVLGWRGNRPVQFADEVEGGQMGGGGKIGQRQGAAGEPFAGLREPADIVEVIAQRGVAGADRGGVGIAAPGQPAEVFLTV